MNFDFLSPGIKQFLIFAVVGVWNTLFDLFLWQVITNSIKPNSRLDKFINKIKLNRYSFSHAISFIITNVLSYFLNKSFTFAGAEIKNETSSVGKFFVVSLFSFALTTFALNYLTKSKAIEKFIASYPKLEKWWPQVAKILVVGASMFINFFGYKLFVF